MAATPIATLTVAGGQVMAFGEDLQGQLGLGAPVPTLTPTKTPTSTATKTPFSFPTGTLTPTATPTIPSGATPMAIPGLSGVKSVAAGGDHSLALTNDGSIWGWGSNGSGQVGDGSQQTRRSPVHVTLPASVSLPIAIAAGDTHSLALLADGTVLAWGDNGSGQLGDGTTTARSAPVTVALPIVDPSAETVTSIAAGATHSLALTTIVDPLTHKVTGHNLYTWGDNSSGQLGLGSGSPPRELRPTLVSALSKASIVTIASGGGHHSVAAAADGTVWTWGFNSYGQLGDGTTTNSSVPVHLQGPPSGVIAVAASEYHTVALTDGGAVWSWGGNAFGELGTGKNNPSLVPVPVANLSNVRVIAAGDRHTLAITADGSLWAWGYNNAAQLGDGTSQNQLSPVRVSGLTNVNAIAAGFRHSLAVGGALANGSPTPVPTAGALPLPDQYEPDDLPTQAKPLLVGFPQKHSLSRSNSGTNDTDWVYFVALTPGWVAFTTTTPECDTQLSLYDPHLGVLPDGQPLTTGTQSAATSTNQPSLQVLAFDAGGAQGFASRIDYQFTQPGTYLLRVRPYIYEIVPGAAPNAGTCDSYVLAAQQSTQPTPTTLPSNTPTATVTPTRGPTSPPTPVGPASNPYAWGAGYFGQLGGRTTADSLIPRLVRSIGAASAVAAGGYHGLAQGADGRVWAWGSNTYGELGLDPKTTPMSDTATMVPGLSGVGAIAAGADFSMALGTDGTIRTWGRNLFGQLGIGSQAEQHSPQTVSALSGVTAIGAGNTHSLAVAADKTVWSWGDNFSGELGDGTTTQRPSPVQVPGLSGVTSVAGGDGHSLALKSDGTVWAWGSNSNGQLGDGTTIDRHTAVAVTGLSGIRSIAASGHHSLALAFDGTVYSWGANDSSQIGDGTTTDRSQPVSVMSGAVGIGAGYYHSLALRYSDPGTTVWGWGDNSRGQLGTNNETDYNTPAQVTTFTVARAITGLAGGYASSLAVAVPGSPVLTVTPTPTGIAGTSGWALPNIIHSLPIAHGFAFGIGYDPSANQIYLAHPTTGVVSVLDGSTFAEVAAITVGNNPRSVVINPTTKKAYVSNVLGNTISVISTTSLSVTNTITFSGNPGPAGLAVDPKKNRIYVSNYFGNSLAIIDGATDTQIGSAMNVGSSPSGVDVDTTTGLVYTGVKGSNQLWVMDSATNSQVSMANTGVQPLGVSVSEESHHVYISNSGEHPASVSILDAANRNSITPMNPKVTIGDGGTGIRVNPNTQRVFAAASTDGNVSVIDGGSNSMLTKLPVGNGAGPVAVNAGANQIYVGVGTDTNPGLVVIQDYLAGQSAKATVVPGFASCSTAVCITPTSHFEKVSPVPYTPPPFVPATPPSLDLPAVDLGTPTPASVTRPLVKPVPTLDRTDDTPPPLLTSLDQLPAGIPAVPPESGGTLALIQPGPGETAMVSTNSGAPLAARVNRSRAIDRTLILRLVPTPLSDDVRSVLPAGALWPVGLQVDFYTPDATLQHRLAQPLGVCVQVPAELQDSLGGDLHRLSLLRFEPSVGRFERWPLAPALGGDGEVCIETTMTSLFALAVLPTDVAERQISDPRFSDQTGFRVEDDAMWAFMQSRGGPQVLGYPVSRSLTLQGMTTQVFQNRILRHLPDGSVDVAEMLDPSGLLPYRHLNGTSLPPADPILGMETPADGEPNFALRALSFVMSHTMHTDPSLRMRARSAYFDTVQCTGQSDSSICANDAQRRMNFDLWGFPLNEPFVDPAAPQNLYQPFQRAVLRVDLASGAAASLPLGQAWTSLVTGRGLGDDLDTDARPASPYWRQYNPLNVENGVRRSRELPGGNMMGAFEPDLPREEITAASYTGAVPTPLPVPPLSAAMNPNRQQPAPSPTDGVTFIDLMQEYELGSRSSNAP